MFDIVFYDAPNVLNLFLDIDKSDGKVLSLWYSLVSVSWRTVLLEIRPRESMQIGGFVSERTFIL